MTATEGRRPVAEHETRPLQRRVRDQQKIFNVSIKKYSTRINKKYLLTPKNNIPNSSSSKSSNSTIIAAVS